MQYAIYVPGVGDAKVGWQRFAVWTWRLWGVRPLVVQMLWANHEPPKQKIARLVAAIDDCAKTGDVILVGASAGAAAVITAFAERPQSVRAVVCIAGKINNNHPINTEFKKLNPALQPIVLMVPAALKKLSSQKQRIFSLRAAYDPIVPADDSIVAGARNRRLWLVGHVITIAAQITFGAPRFLRAAILVK